MSRARWTRPLILGGALLPLVLLQPAVAQAAAAGNAKAYTLSSARWNPCAGPIDYEVNLARAPKGSLAEVKKAFAKVGAATGLTFRYAGTTSAIPDANKGYPGKFPAGTEVVIAWATPGVQSAMLGKKNGAAGMGGWQGRGAYTATGGRVHSIQVGKIVLSAPITKTMARGFGAEPRGTTGELLMHEIGHAVGLDHPKIKDPRQIMYPMLTSKKAVWGAGDLVGLRKVGKSAGCLYDENPKA